MRTDESAAFGQALCTLVITYSLTTSYEFDRKYTRTYHPPYIFQLLLVPSMLSLQLKTPTFFIFPTNNSSHTAAWMITMIATLPMDAEPRAIHTVFFQRVILPDAYLYWCNHHSLVYAKRFNLLSNWLLSDDNLPYFLRLPFFIIMSSYLICTSAWLVTLTECSWFDLNSAPMATIASNLSSIMSHYIPIQSSSALLMQLG